MAYTSGRTVKSSKATQTPVAKATAEARKLVKRYLSNPAGVTVSTVKTAHPVTLDVQVRTTITWPGDITPEHIQLGAAITELGGYVGAMNDNSSITFLRNA